LTALLLATAIATGVSSGGAAGADSSSPQPYDRQTRTYSISIDGTRRGSSKAEFRSKEGVVWIQSESVIKISYLVYKYNYSSSGTEVWKHGRVAAFENTADYNGTPFNVKGTATPRGLQITTNGTTTIASPDVWDTSYLILPDRLARDPSTVTLLDSDKGALLSGKVQFVGEERLDCEAGQKACTHYHVSGDVQVDVWFDASHRLVRQESRERGHKVRFELLSVTAE
jgi:hypothetical protein